ncbi:MAG: MFS transporter, partial [Myxococcota bacterium]
TILGSVLGGALASRVGLKALLAGAAVLAASSQMLLLIVGLSEPGANSALPMLLAATGMLGLGFGIAAAPLNAFPALLFPRRADSALLALHTVIGLGFSVGPLIAGALVARGQWVAFPGGTLVLGLGLALAAVWARLPAPASPPVEVGGASVSWSTLGVFGLIAVLYAFAEGSFSNWAAVFLHDGRGVEEATAALALSAFWAALTVGRLALAGVVARVSAEMVWLLLLPAMAGVFLLLPLARGAWSGIGLFVLAGLSTSAFFPLTVAIASKRFPGREPLISSLLIAALMVGVGGGSFLLGALREQASFESIYRISAIYPAGALALALPLVLWGRTARNNS